jgi:uncharacterized 2Fe-2S/4Fe-4S cluster protein (DUF4445 family)
VSAETNDDKYELVFEPFGKRVTVKSNALIMDAARELMIDVSTICGERGTCGKCKVRIDSGIESLGPLKPAELRHLLKDQIDMGYRLACVCRVRGPMTIWVPDFSRQGRQRLQTEGLDVPVALSPSVRKYFLKMPRASLEDSRGDDDRLLDALEKQHSIQTGSLEFDFGLLKNLATILRDAYWQVTVTIWNGTRIIAIEPGDTTARNFGFAMDIGSTKLAGFLMDLNTGNVLARAARMNPQIPYGDEIMSRLTYAMNGPEQSMELQHILFKSINEILEECCKNANVQPHEIYECVFAGNTSMEHLFLGLRAKNVGFAPYASCFTRALNILPQDLPPLYVNPAANIHVSAVIGGQIGGDSVGDLLVAGMPDSKEIIFDIDVGTNTEIAVGNRDRIVMCSVPSGPAFEGMQIRHGMRAASGAIEKVSVDSATFEVWYSTIDDAKPIGICGSALIDIPAEFLKSGVMDTSGKFNDALKENKKLKGRLRKGSEGMEFVLAWRGETGTDTDIAVTENDIRELAKAKGAMRAGASIIMNIRGVTEKDLTKVYVAGAFGNYIDPESARTIGMFPEVPIEKISFVGNSAGTGARMMLASKEIRQYAQKMASSIERAELALQADFPVEYAGAMHFPHMNLDLYPTTKELLIRLGKIRA